MAARNPKEVFLKLLSDVRQGTERTTKVFQELSQIAQDPDVKEALEARIFVSESIRKLSVSLRGLFSILECRLGHRLQALEH